MDLPLRKKHISMWWVSKIKFAFDGKPNKLKLTEKKYEQNMGIDIDNIYALNIKWNMVRFVVALVVTTNANYYTCM